MEDLFFKKGNIAFHPFDGCSIKKDNKTDDVNYEIKWANKTTSKGIAIIPIFCWLEKLYNFKLTDEQEKKLKEYFQCFSHGIEKEYFDSTKFPGVTNTNLLEIFANALELSYVLRNLGLSFFGDNFEKARTELRIERRNFKDTEIYHKKFEQVCKNYGVKLNKYNSGLIAWLTIFDFGIAEDFPQINTIVPGQNLRNEYNNPLLFTIADVLISSFMDNEAITTYQYYKAWDKRFGKDIEIKKNKK